MKVSDHNSSVTGFQNSGKLTIFLIKKHSVKEGASFLKGNKAEQQHQTTTTNNLASDLVDFLWHWKSCEAAVKR